MTERLERVGPGLATVVATADATTLVDTETLFFATLPGVARPLASDGQDCLLESQVGDQFELWVVSPSRPGVEQTRITSVPESSVVGAISTAMVAVVSATRRLTVHSVVGQFQGQAELGSVATVPLHGSGVVRAIGLASRDSPFTVAVAVGSVIVLYSVSASYQLNQAYRIVSNLTPSVPTIYAVAPISGEGDLWAVTGTELVARLGPTTIRVKLPTAIGCPVRGLVCLSTGIVVVGPTGAWGVSFVVHRRRRMHGKRFVQLCHGAYGAVPLPTGDGVTVWRGRDGDPVALRLTDRGFVAINP